MKQYNVTGMSCAACSARVEKAVSNVPGVTACSVSLLTNSMGVEGTAADQAIIDAVQAAGYGASVKGAQQSAGPAAGADALADHETPKLRRRLFWSLGFLLVLMYFSMGHMMWGWPLPKFYDGNHVAMGLTQLLLTVIIMVINQKFFISGFQALWHRAPNMDTLVALGATAAFVYSTYALFAMTGAQVRGDEQAVMNYMMDFYFESAAMILTLITVGKTLEARSKGKTTDALRSLMELAPKTATVERDGAEVTVPVEQVQTGDVFVVRPGERIPVDGVVLAGTSAVNEAALTGESIPADKAPGAAVSAATVNQSGFLKCRATRVGEDTTLSQIIQMVSDAAATKAPIAKIADKVSGVFVPAVMGIALVTFVVWLLLGRTVGYALARGISVLVISCPCALGLATPVAIMVGSGMGAKNGILFKTAASLEETGRIQIVALDKTGTITRGVVDAAADWDKPSYEQDTVKEGSREAIAALRARGIRTVMLSGDKAEVAGRIAREVGIDTVICEVKPDGKAYWIAKLQRERDEATAKSAYGTSRALAQADLGIAIGTGTDVAMQSADVTLMSGDLRGVIKTINLSNATMRNIRENLGWAFGYNVIGIPVAAGVLYPFTGWLLSPMIAGLAMALSSVCLVLNANRLHGANINVGAADGPAGSGSSTADVESAGSAESANAANITGSATSNAPHEPTVIIDDRTTLNQTNHVSDQSNNPTNKENTMDTGMHMHHTAPADGETATDPVCGMTVAVNADAITREYEGKSYYFCGEHCATNFMKAPQVFLEQ